ncbi:MAG TPA: 1-acyl-sn-glycerol-3-phosphate acyltransferase [Pirellulales bacterium]|jgi:1-acyl-sn-glycerol-3-phosphate acyltransferase|nr:1-acyl-sn-glycerol-3-phosphate acyltransferase [Pirellulales bacterium]
MFHILLADATNLLAGSILTVLFVAGLAAMLLWWRRSQLTFGQTLLWLVNYLIARLLWGTRVEGSLPQQEGVGAVIVSNHRSGVDPSFIQTCVRRVVYWMVAREYCEIPGLGYLLRILLQVIPVGRGGIDTAATKLAIRLAQQGGLVGMFLEGRINETDKLLLPGRPGAALVALKARVPVIPVFITGSPYDGTPLGPLKMRAHVRVKIGQPIDLSQYYGREKEAGVMEEITKQLLREIARLAGQPNFEPQLAGRRWKRGEEEIENGNGNGVESNRVEPHAPASPGENVGQNGHGAGSSSPIDRPTTAG